jgi:peptidoglycan-N-acetylglucosamine deacetylase
MIRHAIPCRLFAMRYCLLLFLLGTLTGAGPARGDTPVQRPAARLPAPEAQPIRCGPEDAKQVALTFDDGPTAHFTPQVLAILKQHKVKATFFVLGQQAHHSPDLVRRVVEEGHLLATHSYSHPKRLSLEKWREELQRTQQALLAARVQPSAFFRPPHGIINDAVKTACGERGLQIILYTLLSSDWQRPGAEALVKQVVSRSAPGGIIVLHDGGGDRRQTVEALPAIIRGLRQRGLEPVRLDALLGPAPKAHPCARAQAHR